MSKDKLRRILLDKRKKLSNAEVGNGSINIVRQIRQDEKYQNAQTVALYYPYENEPNLFELLKDPKLFVYPKIIGGNLVFINPSDHQTIPTPFGVLEPLFGEEVWQIDYMIIPALAINERNYRIGYGGGFYDRYLEHHNVYTVGISYSFGQVNFTRETHDIKLNGKYFG